MTPEELQKKTEEGYVWKYDILWPPQGGRPMLGADIEIWMYMNKDGVQASPGYKGQAYHMMAFISETMAYEGAYQPFIWNPNAIKMLEDYYANPWSAYVGHGSSGKSRTVAAIAVAEFLMDPKNTSCLVTSTTIPEGKKRIWADVELCWHSVSTYYGGEKYMPGELVPSLSIIRYVDRASGYEAMNRGLGLIPSKEEESKAGIGKMKGFKAPRLRLFLDEGSDISYKIVESAKENLVTGAMVGPDGKKDFRCCITLNANDRGDTGGRLCMPKGGWDKVDIANADSWMSDEDIFVRRFSGWQSPNVLKALAGECGEWEEPYPGLLSLGLLKAQQERNGEDSPNFQRQYLAIWPVGGVVETIFTEDEIRQHGGHEPLERRGDLVAVIWGKDPSFTHGGDRTPMVRIDLIRDPDNGNRMVAQYVETIWLDDGLDPRKSKTLQLRDKFIKVAQEKNILPRNFGCDVTGSGRELMTMINEKWPGGTGFEGITFNAKATNHPVSMLERTPAVEKYANLGVELWMVGKELLMSGQIKNLPKGIIEEMCGRRYDVDNKGKDPQGRVQIEDTPHYKKRLGRSPDHAQALFVALQVARVRYGLLAAAKAAKKPKAEVTSTSPYNWEPLQKRPSKGLRGLAAKYASLKNHPIGIR